MTHDELLALPPVVDVPTAAKVLGIGRSLAYELVRTGQWPTPVVRVRKLIKIPIRRQERRAASASLDRSADNEEQRH